MKTAISLPDGLFRAAEQASERLGIPRSEFYQRALADYLDRHGASLVTDALNQVYRAEQPIPLDPVLDRMQLASLPREAW